MGSYVFSELAVQDLNEICDFIGKTNTKAASKLFDSIRKKCKLVADFPNMGKDYTWIVRSNEDIARLVTLYVRRRK
ncbi:MAG: type II toxin-antitoxin system RelE/ParE family toxin [Limnoraphis robusta]|jgi:toxin ParE1/3/4